MRIEHDIFRELTVIKPKIPHQTYKTIIGQIRAGDIGGATVGVERLKRRIAREEAKDNADSRR
jgi:hypothetical protein